MAKSKIPTTVNDFVVVTLHMQGVPSFPQATAHYLYLQANAPRVPTENTPRELFLVNVPVDATDSQIRRLLEGFLGGARVEDVEFEGSKSGVTALAVPVASKKRKREHEAGEDSAEQVESLPEIWDRTLRRSGSTAIVRMVDKPSVDLAIITARRLAKEGKSIDWNVCARNDAPPLGVARYLSHHKLRYPDPVYLQRNVDNFIANFSASEAALEAQRKRQRSEPDEDGFIMVTRGGRHATARAEHAKLREDSKKREKNQVMEDFYRFQTRERTKAEANDLVRSFQEDVKKVDAMKKRRGKIQPEL